MTKTIIKRVAGIAATIAATEGLLFWISGGKFWQLVLFLILAAVGCWCFTDEKKEVNNG